MEKITCNILALAELTTDSSPHYGFMQRSEPVEGGYMKQTQCDMILSYMQRNGSITDAQARDHIGCHRLAARISDLRARGYKIDSIPKTMVNRYGKRVTFSEYRLA